MKHLLLYAVGVLLLTGCDLPESTAVAQAKAAVETARASDSPPAAPAADPAATAAPVQAAVPDLPPNLPDPVREVVKLAHGRMGDGVVTNFVANIQEPFHLDADQIVYLRDLGLSSAVLESLLSKEQELARLNPAQSASTMPAPTVVVANIRTTNVVQLPTSYTGGQANFTPPQVGPAVAAAPGDQSAPPPSEVNNNFFYESLAPYGNWVTVPTYGYVWRPTCAVVNPGWRPYWNDGCWNWCDSGWYWNSSYSWGWAPFHYGNWVNSPGSGWCWIPGRTWAPSWVTFRSGGGYCGWAPLPPGCGWSAGVGLTWAGSGVSVGFGFGFAASDYCWTPTSYFTAGNCSAYGVYGRGVNQIYNGSTVINNYVVGNNNTIINNGIDQGHIASNSRSEVRKVRLADVNAPSGAGAVAGTRGRPGDPSQLAVYRPKVGTVPTAAGTSPSGTSYSRSEVRPASYATRGVSAESPSSLPGRRPAVTGPDRLPAPNPRTPAVSLHSGGTGASGSSALSGRGGEVRPVTGGNTFAGSIARPGGGRFPGNANNPVVTSRGGTSYSTVPGASPSPSGRLEPRKAPSTTGQYTDSAASASGGQIPQSRPQSAPASGFRPMPGSVQSPAPRNNPRPTMSAPTQAAPSFRNSAPSSAPIQRMQMPPQSVPMSRPSFNSAPSGGGSANGGLQRPGR